MYVPAWVNVYEYVCPLPSDGDFSGPEPIDVTVCGTESPFVQVTFVPIGTVRVAGENAMPEMLTALSAAGGVPPPPPPPLGAQLAGVPAR
jgi:hypothetical protein